MANGITTMNVVQAREKSSEMVKKAREIEVLLENVSREMTKINNEETGTWRSRKAAEVRVELDRFRGMFNRVHEQIKKSARDIETIANKTEQI